MNKDTAQRVVRIAEEAAEGQGVEVFDVELLGKGKLLLRVLIDKEGGVTLDDCEHFSRSFSALLDVENPIQGSYTLEVSSPGLDRPLKRLIDFEKNTGKLARIITAEKMENQNFFVGRIAGTDGNMIRLVIRDRELLIPFDNISRARLEIEL
ncbi:MAG TPA: ribosome maturation factor RimP [Thermodesulfovibrionales bacterium]|nr:ribosome maturation factor RimP [Thermodesulfovibrionales bacterium]